MQRQLSQKEIQDYTNEASKLYGSIGINEELKNKLIDHDIKELNMQIVWIDRIKQEKTIAVIALQTEYTDNLNKEFPATIKNLGCSDEQYKQTSNLRKFLKQITVAQNLKNELDNAIVAATQQIGKRISTQGFAHNELDAINYIIDKLETIELSLEEREICNDAKAAFRNEEFLKSIPNEKSELEATSPRELHTKNKHYSPTLFAQTSQPKQNEMTYENKPGISL